MREQHKEDNRVQRTGRVALITGGSGAIGGATAERLAARGDDLIIAYKSNRERAEDYAKYIADTYAVQTISLPLDVTDRASVQQAVQTVSESWKRLDILVHCAGVTRDKLLVQMREQDFAEAIEVNVTGAFRLMQATLPIMRRAGYGRIVTVTSYAGIQGRSGQSAYAAGKAALIGLTKTVALEEIGYGITANAVAPSVTESAMTEALSAAERERLVASIPLGRMQTPHEAANIIEWLTSEGAGTVSGQVFMADSRTYGW